MKPFDLYNDPIHQRMIIEASAGTGKTYAITRILVRLLLETDLTIDKILVVTFTRMAVRELRERIHRVLHEVLTAARLTDASTCEQQILKLIKLSESKEHAINKIEQAMLGIDDLQVCTIHSFCQKVLSEEALSTGQPFEIETGDGKEIEMTACQDFWRVFNATHSKTETGRHYLDYIIEQISTPDQLLYQIRPLLNANDVEIEHDPFVDTDQFINQLLECTNKLKHTWISEKETVLNELLSCDISGFGEKTVEKISTEIDHFIGDNYLWKSTPLRLPRLTQTYLNDESKLKKNGDRYPVHRFFEICDEYVNLRNREMDLYLSFLISASIEIHKRMEMLCQNRSYLTYDMLLTRLNDALSNPKRGEKLASEIRQRFKCALIDEFQDTDPVQYDIFNRLYPADKKSCSLIMIGDPKQAIYGFRGADIYAYLKARSSVADHCSYSLDKNYRSSEPLVKAVNTLFTLTDNPFINSEISYYKVSSSPLSPNDGILYKNRDSEKEGPADPLKIYYSNGVNSKQEIKNTLFNEMCNQIVHLVQEGERGNILIDRQNLGAGDIAVIVHSHHDIETIRRELQIRGIGAAVYSKESVFNSREAKTMERLLHSILHPSDRTSLCRATTSGLFGSTLKDIQNLTSDDKKWHELTTLFTKLHQVWMTHGIHAAIRHLLIKHNGLQNLLQIDGGIRSVTNLLHLSELMSAHEIENGKTPHSLLRWFKNKIRNTDSNEDHLLRLEDDKLQVKILTIHNSKGLEFPIVFCPTLWDDPFKTKKEIITQYHDSSHNYRQVIHLGSTLNFKKQRADRLRKSEQCAEEARKAYVALTRAKYECRVYWMASQQSHLSGLGSILLGKEKIEALLEQKISDSDTDTLSDQTFLTIFEELNQDQDSSIAVHDISVDQTSSEKSFINQQNIEVLTCRELGLPQQLTSSRQLYSFSSLLSHSNEGYTDDTVDFDPHTEVEPLTDNPSEDFSIFNFPRGRKSGTFLHSLFEDSQFQFTEPELPPEYLGKRLQNNGYSVNWVPILNQMLLNVTKANYGDLKLHDVKLKKSIREMPFQFPTTHITSDNLLDIIRPTSSNMEMLKRGDGFISGFIDLIVEQNGFYYIIDFKSNYLGSSYADYKNENLAIAIEQAQYDMQYHIYTVALKKYLHHRLGKFDYENQFGGVFYLFLRGITSGSDNGIFFHKPDLKTILTLEGYLNRNE